LVIVFKVPTKKQNKQQQRFLDEHESQVMVAKKQQQAKEQQASLLPRQTLNVPITDHDFVPQSGAQRWIVAAGYSSLFA
jgi:hypothetical protein